MDGMCLTIVERSGIPTQIIRGTDDNIVAACQGRQIGTVLVKQ
jgi:hypothetical protein